MAQALRGPEVEALLGELKRDGVATPNRVQAETGVEGVSSIAATVVPSTTALSVQTGGADPVPAVARAPKPHSLTRGEWAWGWDPTSHLQTAGDGPLAEPRPARPASNRALVIPAGGGRPSSVSALGAFCSSPSPSNLIEINFS